MRLRGFALVTLAFVAAALAAHGIRGAEDRAGEGAARDGEIALEPGVLADPSRVPTAAARAIGSELPHELAWGDHAARVEEGRLHVATRSGGTPDLVLRPGEWRVLTLGSKRWPRHVAVFHRDGAWLAASAATLVGGHSSRAAGGEVELLDVDGDGAFDGDADLIRTGDGAFRHAPPGSALWLARRRGTWALEGTGAEDAALRFDEDAEPDWAAAPELAGWRAVNDWRNRFGLAPQVLSEERVAACRRHIAYWQQNGYSAHTEDSAREGYSEAGRRAGLRSSVWGHPGAARLADRIAREVLHRHSLLAYDSEGLGIGDASVGCMIYGGRLAPHDPERPLLVPGRGQRRVPTRIDRELPDPEGIEGFYSAFRGFPVAVYFPRSQRRCTEPRLTVTRIGAQDPLPGMLFTEERPYHRRYSDREIVFVGRDPLQHGTWYRARFRAQGEDGPIDVSWTFCTGNEPLPGGD